MPREPPCDSRNCSFSDSEMWARVANLTQIFPSDTFPVYSNLGFDLLG